MARRRGKNEGTIYKRKDKRRKAWCAEVPIDGQRLTFYAETRKECSVWLKKKLKQIDNGLNYQGEKLTLEPYLEHWLSVCKPSLRPNTWKQYQQIVQQHITPFLGSIRLNDLKPDQIQKFYSLKIESETGRATVRLIHSVLRRSLHVAERWGYIGRNPADLVDKPKPEKREMKALNVEQVYSFLNHCQQSRFDALFYLAVTTGLRRGELLGLKWLDVDWNNRTTLHIQRQLQRISGEGLVLTTLKTRASKRNVVIGEAAKEKLLKHREFQGVEKLFAGSRWQEQNLVFTTIIGTPVSGSNLNRNFKKILISAGLPDIRFHDLRHTAATLMLREGINPKVVQERLGHSSVVTTLDTYSHVLQGMQQDAADRLDEILTPIPVSIDQNQKLY